MNSDLYMSADALACSKIFGTSQSSQLHCFHFVLDLSLNPCNFNSHGRNDLDLDWRWDPKDIGMTRCPTESPVLPEGNKKMKKSFKSHSDFSSEIIETRETLICSRFRLHFCERSMPILHPLRNDFTPTSFTVTLQQSRAVQAFLPYGSSKILRKRRHARMEKKIDSSLSTLAISQSLSPRPRARRQSM